LLADALGADAVTAPVRMLPERRLGLALTGATADGIALANAALATAGITARVSSPKIDVGADGVPNPIRNAFAAAAAQERLVIFKFEAAWCVPCQAIKSQTLAQPDVKALIDARFYLKTIDIDYEPSSAIRLGVGPIPDIRIYDLEGNELARNIGAIGADAMVAMLNAASAAAE
jgi:thiol:disulfide interchange protein